MNWREFFGLLPKAVEDCPMCHGGRTGIVLYHSGDDIADHRRAGERGYYVEHINPGEDRYYDRFCLDCGFRWNHADYEEKGLLTYESDRPEMNTERHSKLGWKLYNKRKERERLAHSEK